MDNHIKEYFRQSSDNAPHGNFHSVISLHEAPDISWKAISQKVPKLCRGWFELVHLSSKDRIEFTHDFWLSKFPYRAGMDAFFDKFFNSLDDIGLFLTQKKFDDPYDATLIYSLKNDNGFFRGSLPIEENNLTALQKSFSNVMLPADYLAFLRIHDGFSKATDCTGVTPSSQMTESYRNFQQMLQQQDPILTSIGSVVNPATLIPFYESFGMPFYQCFWAEWYPEQEMGNVYYSGEAKTISDIFSAQTGPENMAFPTFVDWLIFYLERVE